MNLILLLVFALCNPSKVVANTAKQETELFVLYSQLTKNQRVYLLDVISELKKHSIDFGLRILDVNSQKPGALQRILRGNNKCILTISNDALNKVLSTRTNIPIFSTLVSKFNLDNLAQKYHQLNVNLTGIYHEQPVYRQILLARAINQNLKSISIILGRKTRYYLKEFQALANTLNLTLNFIILKRNGAPNSFLANRNLAHETLLTLNDDHHYSEKKLKSLLMLGNKHDISVIGNKSKDTQLAAIASVQTDMTRLPLQVVSELKSYCLPNNDENTFHGKLKPAIFSKDFQVSINQQIAANFGLTNLSEIELKKKIVSMHQEIREPKL